MCEGQSRATEQDRRAQLARNARSRGALLRTIETLGRDSCHSRVIRNQQYLYPKFLPTTVVKLLQYSGSRVELRDEFSLYKSFAVEFKTGGLNLDFQVWVKTEDWLFTG